MRWVWGVVAVAWSCTFPAQAGDALNGPQLSQTHCRSRHGIQGKPSVPGAPDFTRGDGLVQPDAAMSAIIREGRNAVPGFRDILRVEQIPDLISYLRTFN